MNALLERIGGFHSDSHQEVIKRIRHFNNPIRTRAVLNIVNFSSAEIENIPVIEEGIGDRNQFLRDVIFMTTKVVQKTS